MIEKFIKGKEKATCYEISAAYELNQLMVLNTLQKKLMNAPLNNFYYRYFSKPSFYWYTLT